MSIDASIFNTKKTDYEKPLLFLGQEPGLFDTVNKHYPDIWKIYKTMKSLDWDENEVDYSSCISDFKKADKTTYDMMIKTLAWQWEADSVASRSIAPVLAPFITSSELWATIQRISDNEVLHAATYSEIVRNSFEDPKVIIDEVTRVEEAHSRLTAVSKVFRTIYTTSHEYALGICKKSDEEIYNEIFMVFAALYALERIQFMSSFAVTFAICDAGAFQPIGKIVQKIAQDEFEVHCEFDKTVLKYELETERGKKALESCRGEIQELVDQVVESELEFIKYLFSSGGELPGLTEERLSKWPLFCSKEVYRFFKLDSDITLPKSNPLRYMENWLDISKNQPAPQEEQITAYKVNVVRRNDENLEFDTDF